MGRFNIIFVHISCFINGLIGGLKYEMLSSRAHRQKWFMEYILDEAFYRLTGEINHCKNCYDYEQEIFGVLRCGKKY